MDNLCDACPILFCDLRSWHCVQTPEFKLQKRRQELKAEANVAKLKAWSERMNALKRQLRTATLAAFVPDRSLAVKYDRRRKPDTPLRAKWRRDKQRKMEAQ